MSEKVTKLALASRIIVLVVQLISDALIPDHNADVFKSPTKLNQQTSFLDRTLDFIFSGLRRWDAEYFLHIAEHGYSYENSLAFYPLYPTITGILAKSIYFVGIGVSLRTLVLVVGIALNIYFFCRAANCLYELTQKIFGDLNKSWNAAVIFCFNPASVFFTAPYSEAFFCWLSFSLMLECVGQVSLFTTCLASALGIVCRSNGMLNLGFPVYFILRKIFLKQTKWLALKLVVLVFVSVIPLTFFCFYAFHQFCSNNSTIEHPPEVIQYAVEREYVLAGDRIPPNSPWCDQSFPFPYTYIQNHYWNVGFMNYYEWKQLPNFIIASPIIGFILYQTFFYFRSICNFIRVSTLQQAISEWKSIPFIVHCLFLTIFCTFFTHVQITTRVICSSSPVLYWFAVNHLPKTFDRIEWKSANSVVLLWFSGYFLIGTTLFSNFLPWT
ncbi:GPI mannosyltransferase 2 [Episyrphus balteatus]|uniref:GPI mannosyltransferase 2 n=1 Tax=Episyrphus balteatus TaxID=286459 RepID=UPI0024861689|nr:GPI mannosyltransferase 2 [Episyrphus balteatus]XP_055855894.1 GPI mannosyltransferase 2 [Episyrphus balteatus]